MGQILLRLRGTMRALIIDDQTREKIKHLKALAALNPYTLEQIKAMAAGFDPQDPKTREKRINEDFTIGIPVGYVVTYTHEWQPVGLCRHLSVSVPKAKAYPNPAAIQEIMTLFGFKNALTETFVWEEKYAAGFSAVNVLEEI